MENLDPPLPNWRVLAFARIHSWLDGWGFAVPFYSSKNAGGKTRLGHQCYEENCFEDYTNREEKSLRQVAMIAIFLDDNKPEISLKKWIRTVSNFIALIQFHFLSNIGQMVWGWIQKDRLEKDNFCVVFTYSTESGAWNYEVSCDCRSRATTAKKCTEAWCTCRVVVLLIKTYCFFAVLVTVAVVVGLAHNCCDPAIVTWRHTSLYFNHCWFGKNS